jgi:sRNA-binding protein
MGELAKWVKADWVRIDSEGNIAGPCGTSKDKKNPDRCLPRAKAESLTKAERKATAARKKREGAKGKTVVANTDKAKVRQKAAKGGYTERWSKSRGG